MKILTKALLIGAAIETALAGAFAAGGFGPCGPDNILGFIGMLGHLFPGFLVVSALSAISSGLASGTFGTAAIVLIQGAFWSLLAFMVLSLIKKRKPASTGMN